MAPAGGGTRIQFLRRFHNLFGIVVNVRDVVDHIVKGGGLLVGGSGNLFVDAADAFDVLQNALKHLAGFTGCVDPGAGFFNAVLHRFNGGFRKV